MAIGGMGEEEYVGSRGEGGLLVETVGRGVIGV